jgi:hypothetical protein
MGSRQEPPAAADVEQAQTLKRALAREIAPELGRDLGGDVVEPAGVQHVQRLELAVGVPPFAGHRLELGDFGGIHGIGRALHSRLHHLFEVPARDGAGQAGI